MNTQTKNEVGLVCMTGNISLSNLHHGGGYFTRVVDMIEDYFGSENNYTINPLPCNYNNYDKLLIIEGTNFQEDSKGINIFGGVTKQHTDKLDNLLNYTGEVYTVAKKINFDQFFIRYKMPIKEISHEHVDIFSIVSLKNRKLAHGDSHILSVGNKDFGLSKNDGLTLNSFLNSDKDDWNSKFEETITYLGNIDIRFHICRQENPNYSVNLLVDKYIEFSSSLNDNTMVCLLPIEHESRKIPASGWYKGKPFYGSRDERFIVRNIFNDKIKSSGQKYIEWPESWTDEDGLKMFEYLEPKQSVHLKPKYYYKELYK
jgi:hypothetical protein